ncbi:MAG: leucine-rich repeat protein [Clostridia bacterium]|nr:leucine-rich repeat protein [Clostridia bacterium]
MFAIGFAKRSLSVAALLVLVLILAYSLPGTAEAGTDSSPIEFNDAALEDTFVLIEDVVPIEADLALDLSLEDDAPYAPASEVFDEAIEPNGLLKALTLGIKETYAMNVKKATFKSSRPSIASVNKKGIITAKKKGTTKITVKSGKKTVGTCKVTVVAAPKNVELGLSAVHLGVKEKLQLNPTITEGSHASYTYTVRNKKIATVSKAGVVTARKVGSTTVTVKTHNGKKASLKVTVKKAPAKVTLDPTTLELVAGETAALAVTLPKKTASFMLTWTSDNAEIATVDQTGVVTAVGPGTANITVKTFNDKKASCAVTVMESTTEPRLLSPTDLYRGDIFDDATYPLYGEDDITLVWTAVKGAVRYDLVIKRYGYTGDGSIFHSLTIDPPKDDGATVTITLKKDYLDGFGVQDRMGLTLIAFDSLDNDYSSHGYNFRWIRDFNSLEYDFYYARDGKNDFISFPDGSGKITGVVLTRYYGKDKKVKIPAKFGGYPVRSLNQTFNLGNRDIVEAIIPEGVNEIGLWPFEDCTKLRRITIPNTVTTIGASAFGNCISLKEIDIPNSVIYLSGFDGCTGLKNIYIPDSVITIAGWAFEGCTGLSEIVIPESVETIGQYAFSGCKQLKKITIPASIHNIDDTVFDGCTALKTVRGSQGSYAQTWAEEHGYTFVGLGN